MQISKSPSFIRAYRKRILKNSTLVKAFEEKIIIFEKEPFHSSLKTHKLTGHLDGYWSFSVSYDCRVIFSFASEEKVILVDIGKHDEVY